MSKWLNRGGAAVADEENAVAESKVEGPAADCPQPMKPQFDEETVLVREWLKTAQDLGMKGAAVGDVELKLFLQDAGIQMFRTQRVFDYLSAEAKKASTKTWALKPVREQDRTQSGELWAKADWPDNNKYDPAEIYRGVIPLAVLLTMKTLVEHFGERVKFYVAYADDYPFLAVSLDECSILFVERWDEPSFR